MKKGLKKRQESYEEYSVAEGDYTIKSTDNPKKKKSKRSQKNNQHCFYYTSNHYGYDSN